MNSEDNRDRDREVRERIVSLMRSIGQAPRKPITMEESQKLKAAANRLDEMLKAGAEAERQVLRSATTRLDQLLSDIRAGKDVSNDLKRRNRQHRGE